MNSFSSRDMDTRITHWFVAQWGQRLTVDSAMAVVSACTPMLMVAVIACAAFGVSLDPEWHHLALLHSVSAIVAATVGRIVNEPVSRLFHRNRPFQADIMTPLVDHKPGDSFPSNHATGAFALSLSMVGIPGYSTVLICLAVLLAISRVYVGLHYATDVIAGMIHGAVVAWSVGYVFQLLHIGAMLSAW